VTRPKSPPGAVGLAAAPLLYWLLVLSGLVGLTVVRVDAIVGPVELDERLAPMWVGTVAGVAVGQLLAWRRVRAWVLVVAGFATLPVLAAGSTELLRDVPEQTLALAFAPAAVCGYLSLSERGGLAAFWYPAVLWMLVAFDGGATLSGLGARETLPFAVGLAGLFVAFLGAREARRVALWQTHAAESLAPVVRRAVLRARPARRALHVGRAGALAVGALVVAAWIAPHLVQRETAWRARAAAAAAAPGPVATVTPRCCPAPGADAPLVRPREYFPLLAAAEEAPPAPTACMTCVAGPTEGAYCAWYRDTHGGEVGAACGARSGSSYAPTLIGGPFAYADAAPVEPSDSYGGGYGGPPAGGSTYGAGGYGGATYGGTTYGGTTYGGTTYGGTTYGAPTTDDSANASPPEVYAAPAPADPGPTLAPAPVAAPVAPSAPPALAPQVDVPPAPEAPVAPPAGQPGPPQATHPTTGPSAPSPAWLYALAACVAALAVRWLSRAARRALTLRHFTRPYWAETVDQRISNQWQRALIGLRDAGIAPLPDEPPAVFARRVGIEGLSTCATILDRARHGVRVEEGDLRAMTDAATAAYRAARKDAGLTGRALGWIRTPLA
jgi:hypothetical protein